MPIEESTEEINKRLAKMILEGRYSLGELIVPQTYQCLYLDGDEIKIKTFEVSGRKFPISWVRETMNNLQRPYFRLNSDSFYETVTEEEISGEFNRIEEPFGTIDQLKSFQRRRTQACWHDGSPISNASHLLIMFSTVYDRAIYYTDDEYNLKTGDAPACQIEAGHQKGGHYFSWTSKIKSSRTMDVAHKLNAKHLTLQDKIDILKSTG
ncbi:uncharacterized protein [Clytia hemisphaerica]